MNLGQANLSRDWSRQVKSIWNRSNQVGAGQIKSRWSSSSKEILNTKIIFWPKFFWTQYFLITNLFDKKFFWTQIVFDTKYIFTRIFFTHFFWINIFCDPKLFEPKISFTQIFFITNIFWLKFCLGPKNFLDQIYLDPTKIIWTMNFFDQKLFLERKLRTWKFLDLTVIGHKFLDSKFSWMRIL